MAKIVITKSLFKQLRKSFTDSEVGKVIDLIESLESQPKKGKALSQVGGIVIKELKYGKHRFYFITDGHMLKFATEDELAQLIIKFVRVSDKKYQQKIINEIKDVLTSFGFEGF